MLLENINGMLVLDVDGTPNIYHDCYYYNDGVFPYIIKRTLNFLVLSDGKDSCLTRIIGVDTMPGTRFRFQEEGMPSVEDPNGDSCIWRVVFEVIPVPDKPKCYLMRWNPSTTRSHPLNRLAARPFRHIVIRSRGHKAGQTAIVIRQARHLTTSAAFNFTFLGYGLNYNIIIYSIIL